MADPIADMPKLSIETPYLIMEMANPMMETSYPLIEMPSPSLETAYPAIDLAYQEETMTNRDADFLLLCYY